MKNSRVKWECNNWYKTDDNLIQIINQSGRKILLNKKQSIIWENINYQNKFEDLYESISAHLQIEKEELEEYLQLFENNKLIAILNEENLFDTFFN